MKAKIKIVEGGKAPFKKHESDSCWDLYIRDTVNEGHCVWVSLGVKIQPPEGYDVRLYPRSSISGTGWVLANSTGIGDESFTGEYKACFIRVEPFNEQRIYPVFPYKIGDRCIQMEIRKKDEVDLEFVDELSNTERGEGGFGSTGNK